MKRLIFTSLFLLCVLFAPARAFAAYTSSICPGDPLSITLRCDEKYVGPFMMGITNSCGNAGNCTVNDLMIVTANIGNYILRIVGALVLFMYVLGGFWYLTSRGDSKYIEKGKTALKVSTTGLFIIMFAYLGVRTLYAYLTATPVDTKTVVCDGTNDGKVCDKNKTCQSGACYYDYNAVTNDAKNYINNLIKPK